MAENKERSYAKESKKTNPSGIRFDMEQLEFIQKRESKLNTKQKVVDFLLNKYWWEQKVSQEPNHKGLSPKIQDLNCTTSEIKPFEQPVTNYPINTNPQPLNPAMSSLDAYATEIKSCGTKQQLETVVKRIKTGMLNWKDKQALQEIANKHFSENFFND